MALALALVALVQDSVSVVLPTNGAPGISWVIGAAAVAVTSLVTAPFKGVDSKAGAFLRPFQPVIALALPVLASKLHFLGGVDPAALAGAPAGTLVSIAALEAFKAIFKRPAR